MFLFWRRREKLSLISLLAQSFLSLSLFVLFLIFFLSLLSSWIKRFLEVRFKRLNSCSWSSLNLVIDKCPSYYLWTDLDSCSWSTSYLDSNPLDSWMLLPGLLYCFSLELFQLKFSYNSLDIDSVLCMGAIRWTKRRWEMDWHFNP